jgi:hypothetical protein
MQNFVRVILFVVFFSIGAASLSSSILYDDLNKYYQNRQLLKLAQESLERLKDLNEDYDVLLSQLESDPNLIKRIAPATFGVEKENQNTINPKAEAWQLAAAKKALEEEPNQLIRQRRTDSALKRLLSRYSEPHRRAMLAAVGSALILTSFVFFLPHKTLQKLSDKK